jgi:hypothetical protein
MRTPRSFFGESFSDLTAVGLAARRPRQRLLPPLQFPSVRRILSVAQGEDGRYYYSVDVEPPSTITGRYHLSGHAKSDEYQTPPTRAPPERFALRAASCIACPAPLCADCTNKVTHQAFTQLRAMCQRPRLTRCLNQPSSRRITPQIFPNADPRNRCPSRWPVAVCRWAAKMHWLAQLGPFAPSISRGQPQSTPNSRELRYGIISSQLGNAARKPA